MELGKSELPTEAKAEIAQILAESDGQYNWVAGNLVSAHEMAQIEGVAVTDDERALGRKLFDRLAGLLSEEGILSGDKRDMITLNKRLDGKIELPIFPNGGFLGDSDHMLAERMTALLEERARALNIRTGDHSKRDDLLVFDNLNDVVTVVNSVTPDKAKHIGEGEFNREGNNMSEGSKWAERLNETQREATSAIEQAALKMQESPQYQAYLDAVRKRLDRDRDASRPSHVSEYSNMRQMNKDETSKTLLQQEEDAEDNLRRKLEVLEIAGIDDVMRALKRLAYEDGKPRQVRQ